MRKILMVSLFRQNSFLCWCQIIAPGDRYIIPASHPEWRTIMVNRTRDTSSFFRKFSISPVIGIMRMNGF